MSELRFLADWVATVDAYLASKAPDPELDQLAAESTRRALERGDLRGLREARRDALETALGLQPEDQEELDVLLVTRTGTGLDVAHGPARHAVERILKRGRIANATEYRMLSSRADEIHSDPSADAELARVNELLRHYEERAKP